MPDWEDNAGVRTILASYKTIKLPLRPLLAKEMGAKDDDTEP
jgi:hypothetical protein